MKKILIIVTPYGDRYFINSKGQLYKKGVKPSGGWILKGIEHVKNSWFIPFKDLTEKYIESLNLLYKNGHPQFTVRDLDHGTTRVWGNTKVHGIKYLYYGAEE